MVEKMSIVVHVEVGKLRSETNRTKVSPKFLLMKSSENNFIFSPVYYLIIVLMKAYKNFEKIAILKTQELVSF